MNDIRMRKEAVVFYDGTVGGVDVVALVYLTDLFFFFYLFTY